MVWGQCSISADKIYAKLPEESLNLDVASDFYGAQSTFDERIKHFKIRRGTIFPVRLQSSETSFDLTNFALKDLGSEKSNKEWLWFMTLNNVNIFILIIIAFVV